MCPFGGEDRQQRASTATLVSAGRARGSVYSHANHVALPCAHRSGATYRVPYYISLHRPCSPPRRSQQRPPRTMDRGQLAQGGAKSSEPAHHGSATLAQIKPSSPPISARYSPTTPLVPLEYLQNQRRGSITDPSLHAAGPSGHNHSNNSPPNSNKPPSSRSSDPSVSSGRYSSVSPNAFSKKNSLCSILY